MKTLVVLYALAAIVATAPPLPEYRYGGYTQAPYYHTVPNFRREKKSPTAGHLEVIPALETPTASISEPSHVSEVSARTFFKKPIIVKKKLGYHLYRDSGEEQAAQADSQEKCTKEVKVKLCDAENLQSKVSDLKENGAIVTSARPLRTETDMEQSIKMAKEAVENLQKASDWKHTESGPDSEIHKDIEVARQALEHIQKNFGNLESMNMRATTLSDAEALKDAHLEISKEERTLHWKEAMDNIKKNPGTVKNLEDSFTDQAHSSLRETKLENSNIETEGAGIHKTTTKSTENKHEDSWAEKTTDVNNEPVHDEMQTSASETRETLLHDHEQLMAREDLPVKIFEDQLHNTVSEAKNNLVEKYINVERAKAAHSDVPLAHLVLAEHVENLAAKEVMDTKSAELLKKDRENEKFNGSDKLENAFELSHPIENTLNKKSVESAEQIILHAAVEKDDNKELEKSLQNSNNARWTSIIEDSHTPDSTIDSQAKSDVMSKHASERITTPSMKSTETVNHKILNKELNKEDATHAQLKMKSSDNSANVPKVSDHGAIEKSSDQVGRMSEKKEQKVLATGLHNQLEADLIPKTAESWNFHQQMNDNSKFHEQAKSWQTDHITSMKNAAIEQTTSEFHNTEAEKEVSSGRSISHNFHTQAKSWKADHMASMKNVATEQSISDPERAVTFGMPTQHFSVHPQAHFSNMHHGMMHPHMHDVHHFHNMHGVPFKAVEQMRFEGKAAEMDTALEPSMQVNMNEHFQKSAVEHNGARGVYGAYGLAGAGTISGAGSGLSGGSAGGSGAIGVFPHASVSDCGIPLLLSCSPSVVSGSLAKVPSAYGSPAYRAGENINFHTKRDAKNNDIPSSKVKITRTKVVQKIPYNVGKRN